MAAPNPFAAPPVIGSDRGSERGKRFEQLGGWHAPITVGEFDGGYKLLYLPHHKDTALLGTLMGHCSGTHFVWSCELRIWYFFALVDEKGVPHGTLHTKEEKWLNKAHPFDSKPRIPIAPDRSKDRYGGYPTKEDFLRAFAREGTKYEDGTYNSHQFSSTTYDISAHDAIDYDANTFRTRFRNPLARRPDGIPEDLYAQFTQCWKAMEDYYDKIHGAVKITGRTFYFDGKKQIVLSFSGSGQGAGSAEKRRMIFDWLNSHQKKDKALEIANV